MPNGRDGKDAEYFDQDEFLAEVQPVLYRYVLTRISDPDIAREVVQDSIVGFLRKSHPEELDNPRGYLFRVAYNMTVNHYRKKTLKVVDADTDQDVDLGGGDETTPEDWLRYKQFRRQAGRIYNKLPQRQKEVFYLRRVEGLTTAEIAGKLGISRRMVQKYLAQALKYFQERLDKE